ncbi:MAG: hypothetical protein ACMXYL_05325 [Candidatus Woesearchaeota archaeon]
MVINKYCGKRGCVEKVCDSRQLEQEHMFLLDADVLLVVYGVAHSTLFRTFPKEPERE